MLGKDVRSAKIRYHLVWRRRVLRQVQMGQHAFVSIGRLKRNILRTPIGRTFVDGLHLRFEIRFVVGVQALVDVERLIVGWLVVPTVSGDKRYHPGQRLLGGCHVPDAAEPEGGIAIERTPRVRSFELVTWLVPGSTENVAPVPGRVPA